MTGRGTEGETRAEKEKQGKAKLIDNKHAEWSSNSKSQTGRQHQIASARARYASGSH